MMGFWSAGMLFAQPERGNLVVRLQVLKVLL